MALAIRVHVPFKRTRSTTDGVGKSPTFAIETATRFRLDLTNEVTPFLLFTGFPHADFPKSHGTTEIYSTGFANTNSLDMTASRSSVTVTNQMLVSAGNESTTIADPSSLAGIDCQGRSLKSPVPVV